MDSHAKPVTQKRLSLWRKPFVLFLLIVALGSSLPLYRVFKKYRARALAENALKSLEAGQPQLAAEQGLSAYQLSPEDPTTLRTYARLQATIQSPKALQLWQQLIDTGKATPQDRLEYARLALAQGALETAETQVLAALASGPNNVDYILLKGEILARRGQFNSVEAWLRGALARVPKDPQLTLALARLYLQSPDPAKRDESIALLSEVANGAPPTSREALSLLLSPAMRAETRIDALKQAKKLSPVSPNEELPWLQAELELYPERQKELIDLTLKKFEGREPLEIVELLRWMNSRKLHSYVIDFLTLDKALSRQDYFLCYADALASLGKWSELEKILKNPRIPLDATYVAVFQARTAKELGDRTTATLFWERALQAARGTPELLWYLARYAETSKEREPAEKALRMLMKSPVTAPVAAQELARFLERNGSTRELRDALREALEVLPTSHPAQNDVAYLNLLLNEKIEESYELAKQLTLDHPEFLAYRTTFALACLRKGTPSAAAPVYERINLDWSQVQPGWIAVRAATLAANGQIEAAKELLPLIDLPRLKPEERALIADLLAP